MEFFLNARHTKYAFFFTCFHDFLVGNSNTKKNFWKFYCRQYVTIIHENHAVICTLKIKTIWCYGFKRWYYIVFVFCSHFFTVYNTKAFMAFYLYFCVKFVTQVFECVYYNMPIWTTFITVHSRGIYCLMYFHNNPWTTFSLTARHGRSLMIYITLCFCLKMVKLVFKRAMAIKYYATCKNDQRLTVYTHVMVC